MRRSWLALLGFVVLSAVLPAHAQISTRGRIFLPTGEPLFQVTQVILTSEDARFVPVYLNTDAKGWFYLQALRNNGRYSVTVESDGESYDTTTEWFIAGQAPFITIHLRPLERVVLAPSSSVVTAHQLQHQPAPQARKAFEEAHKAISEQKLDLARRKLRQAIEIDPAYVSAYNELAVLEIGARRYTEAESLLRSALQEDPEAAYLHANLGLALDYQGRFPDAIEPLRKALQLRPQWLAPKIYLGVALLETNELKEAETLLLRGIGVTGLEEALAYLYLGKLYVMKGDREKAIAHWEKYLQLDPDSPNAANVREVLTRLRPPSPQP